MKTIDERGDAYIHENARQEGYDAEDVRTAYIDGAEAEHKLLTRWHDPKEELPEYYKVVEVKWYDYGLIRISTAWLSAGDAGGYLWTIEGTSRLINVKNIIGWREIQE